ncbi:MAG: hypothetical protein D6814_14945 [Calditrichaeota bacterium]|nr:MAG: hypothetical protein D6814_14945 [Calditrichota bacterium]
MLFPAAKIIDTVFSAQWVNSYSCKTSVSIKQNNYVIDNLNCKKILPDVQAVFLKPVGNPFFSLRIIFIFPGVNLRCALSAYFKNTYSQNHLI